MSNLLTISQVAKLAHRSRSSVHRDIRQGLLPIAQTVPGYRGAFLVEEEAANDYAESMMQGQP